MVLEKVIPLSEIDLQTGLHQEEELQRRVLWQLMNVPNAGWE
jgi:hypothetical protein